MASFKKVASNGNRIHLINIRLETCCLIRFIINDTATLKIAQVIAGKYEL